MRNILAAAAILLALPCAAAWAQAAGGEIHGRTVAEFDNGVAGITVRLEGDAFEFTDVSGAGGRFVFRAVPPGTYRVMASGPRVATARVLDVHVHAGVSVDLTVVMKSVAGEETITALAGLPAVDRRSASVGAVFTADERERIPQPLDPSGVLASTPGLVPGDVDRFGADGSPPPVVQSRGARPTDTVWYVDGVEVRAPSVAGILPRHGALVDEIAVSTAGQDLRHATGGAALNLVTRRGGDRWRASARGSIGLGSDEGGTDRIDDAGDLGVEAGGPVARGLSFWGAIGHERVRVLRDASGRLDPRTEERSVTSAAARLDWQATPSDRAGVSWTGAFSEHTGLATGDQPDEADSATWVQRDWREGGGPPGLFKIEGHHLFAAGVSLTARYAHVGDGLRFDPRGGLDLGAGSSFLSNRSSGSTRAVRIRHPQHVAALEGSWLAAGHDVRFGAAYRRVTAAEETQWPGDGLQSLEIDAADRRARLHQGANAESRVEHWSLYLGDSIVWYGLVASAGLRYDHQTGSALPSELPAHPVFPGLAPAVRFDGYDGPFEWSNLSPRIGLAYTLDAVRRSVARLSFSRYTGRLSPFEVGYASPAASGAFTDYAWNDLDGDGLAQPAEVVTAAPLTSGATFGGGDGLGGLPVAIDEELRAPRTTEFVAAFDYEYRPGLTLGFAYVHQRLSNLHWQPRTGRFGSEYVEIGSFDGVLPDGASYAVPYFAPVADGGRVLSNRHDYHQHYNGWQIHARRGFADGWMLRGSFAYDSHREVLDARRTATGNPTPLDTDPLASGEQAAPRTVGGDAGEAFLNRRWTLSVAGLRRLPFALDLAGHLLGRQGLAQPLFRPVSLGADGPQRVLVSGEVDAFRYDDLWTLDLRLSRAMRAGRATAAIDADVLNVFGSRPEVARARNLSTPPRGPTRELAGRLFRLGLRVSF